MRWITRERIKVDRVACPWLITHFIDPAAEFPCVPPEQVLTVADRERAIPFDVPGVAFGHHDGKCSFEAILAREFIVYDALYAYCREQMPAG